MMTQLSGGRDCRQRKGAILLFALLVMMVVSSAMLAILQSLLIQSKLLSRADRQLQAKCLAAAGEAHGAASMRRGKAYTGEVWQVRLKSLGPTDLATPRLGTTAAATNQFEEGRVEIVADPDSGQLQITAEFPNLATHRVQIRRICHVDTDKHSATPSGVKITSPRPTNSSQNSKPHEK